MAEDAEHYANMKRDQTPRVTLTVTVRELELLTTLASDQLFRREFIDPKMPGYKYNSAEMSLGKALVERLRSIAHPGFVRKTSPLRITR
jgi:hypothetical protein